MHTPHTLRSSAGRARTALRRGAVVIAATTAATLFAFGGSASAEEVGLPVNALAPQVTAEADRAVVAYDRFVETEELTDFLVYSKHRRATAHLAAEQLGYDQSAMNNAWMSAPLDHQRAVLAAMTQVGVPYRSNTSSEGEGFDCSGLTTFAWQESGVQLERSSGAQIRAALDETRDTAKAGDLVYYPGHVMMYLGVGDAIIHSVQTGRTVEIDTISSRRTDSVRFGDPTP